MKYLLILTVLVFYGCDDCRVPVNYKFNIGEKVTMSNGTTGHIKYVFGDGTYQVSYFTNLGENTVGYFKEFELEKKND